MNVDELIGILNKIENKTKPVEFSVLGKSFPLDNLVGVLEWADVVVLQGEIRIGGME